LRILHFSDTHLGYSDLDKVGRNGVNLREQDFYDAFSSVIDQALEIKPDLIIHSGDFFHRPSPFNRPMIFALEQLNRLAAADIPIVIIAGNHETPKTIYTSPILRAFQTINGVHAIFKQEYQTIEFGNLVIHGLPHINEEKVLLQEMDKIQPIKDRMNIILLHTSIGKDYIMEEFGESLYPPERMELLNQFDYVALGHWHNYQKVKKLKAGWYCGSTERMSDTEAGKAKGFCVLDLAIGKEVVPEFIPIQTRNWYRIDIKKCQEKSVEALETEIIEAVKDLDLKDAIVSIYFQKILAAQSIALSQRKIQELLSGTMHVHIKRNFSDVGFAGDVLNQASKSTDVLLKEFIIANVEGTEKSKALAEKAKEYFDLFESGEYKNR